MKKQFIAYLTVTTHYVSGWDDRYINNHIKVISNTKHKLISELNKLYDVYSYEGSKIDHGMITGDTLVTLRLPIISMYNSKGKLKTTKFKKRHLKYLRGDLK